MGKTKILIVEDEIIIADTIQRYLELKGHEVVGNAISYDEAVEIIAQTNPDLALLDIRLSGVKSGIDLANYIQQSKNSFPFIFLTSQLDSKSINLAKKTFPAGYLSKPIQVDSLLATIEIAMHNHLAVSNETKTISLNQGNAIFNIPINDIEYLQSDHIYVRVHLVNGDQIIHRSPLKELLDLLPKSQFIQSHRSFAVNINHIIRWDYQYLHLKQSTIPISRSRKKIVVEQLTPA